MEEVLTVQKIAKLLGISDSAVKTRLSRKGIAPFEYIGSAGRYTAKDVEAIRDGGTRGRPKAKSPEKPAAKATKKNTKKVDS